MNNLIKRIKHWYRTTIQNKITVLDILEYANKHRSIGLCWSLDGACVHYHRHYSCFEAKCPKFCAEEAQAFNARTSSGWWWTKGEWGTGREKFLKYLIEYYSKQEPIYVEY